MAPVKTPIDRSLAFTALLEVPAFRRMPNHESSQAISSFLNDWYASDETDMYEFALKWAAEGHFGLSS